MSLTAHGIPHPVLRKEMQTKGYQFALVKEMRRKSLLFYDGDSYLYRPTVAGRRLLQEYDEFYDKTVAAINAQAVDFAVRMRGVLDLKDAKLQRQIKASISDFLRSKGLPA